MAVRRAALMVGTRAASMAVRRAASMDGTRVALMVEMTVV
jgi:hypothetical protein